MQRRAWVQHHADAVRVFQSSSGQKAGCNAWMLSPAKARIRVLVSILIRPEGRMQLACVARSTCCAVTDGFNPHPARRPDATGRLQPRATDDRRFNPHPARRPDATRRPRFRPAGQRFQSSSGQKAGCNFLDALCAFGLLEVSILIRPEGRMQRSARRQRVAWPLVSILIRPEGRMQRSARRQRVAWPLVSILIRPEGRMQQPATPITGKGMTKFQSSSGQKAGCNGSGQVGIHRLSLFQSSSGQKAGCNPGKTRTTTRLEMFQSSSGQKAGCNRRRTNSAARVSRFNPHPARRPDATAPARVSGTDGRVSILIRPEGRMQPRRRRCRTAPGSFNPHPARRPDATIRRSV